MDDFIEISVHIFECRNGGNFRPNVNYEISLMTSLFRILSLYYGSLTNAVNLYYNRLFIYVFNYMSIQKLRLRT